MVFKITHLVLNLVSLYLYPHHEYHFYVSFLAIIQKIPIRFVLEIKEGF